MTASDGRLVYESVLAAESAPKLTIPPIRTASVAGPLKPSLAQRDAATMAIGRHGRRQWRKNVGYHQQARAENRFSR